MLRLDRAGGTLWDDRGRRFDPAVRCWLKGDGPTVGEPIDLPSAVVWLQGQSGSACRVPVGVIGPREAAADQLAAAESLGRLLAGMGLTVVCGGKGGVMEATCRGVADGGGLSVGLLPDPDPAAANAFVSVPIATGIGVARNAIVARAAVCLVAVGGGYGTLSEAAFALQFEKPVFGLCRPPPVDGMRLVEDAAAAAEAVASVVLALPGWAALGRPSKAGA